MAAKVSRYPIQLTNGLTHKPGQNTLNLAYKPGDAQSDFDTTQGLNVLLLNTGINNSRDSKFIVDAPNTFSLTFGPEAITLTWLDDTFSVGDTDALYLVINLLINPTGLTATDKLVAVTGDDTTSGLLVDKLVATGPLQLTVVDPTEDESYEMSLADDATLPGTGGVLVPAGTTEQRHGTPTAGRTRFNTTTGYSEYHDGDSWKNVPKYGDFGTWASLSYTLGVVGLALLEASSQSAARTVLGLGTAATQNTGTSGANVPLLNGVNTWSGKQTVPAAASGGAGINLPHGSDPSAPVNGDVWTKEEGVFARVNGVTVQLQTAQLAAFPSGTSMLFGNTAPPTGWTKDTTHNNKALRVVNGTVGTGGSVDFTSAFALRTPAGTVGVGNATLSASHIPELTATISLGQVPDSGGGFNGVQGITNGSASGSVNITANAGSGAAPHNHSGTFTGADMDFRVAYVDVTFAIKD